MLSLGDRRPDSRARHRGDARLGRGRRRLVEADRRAAQADRDPRDRQPGVPTRRSCADTYARGLALQGRSRLSGDARVDRRDGLSGQLEERRDELIRRREERRVVRVELDDALARMLADHPSLERRHERPVAGRHHVRAGNRREHLVVDVDRGGKGRDRLRTPPRHRPAPSARACNRCRSPALGLRPTGTSPPVGRPAIDDVLLDHVALAFREMGEMERATGRSRA